MGVDALGATELLVSRALPLALAFLARLKGSTSAAALAAVAWVCLGVDADAIAQGLASGTDTLAFRARLAGFALVAAFAAVEGIALAVHAAIGAERGLGWWTEIHTSTRLTTGSSGATELTTSAVLVVHFGVHTSALTERESALASAGSIDTSQARCAAPATLATVEGIALGVHATTVAEGVCGSGALRCTAGICTDIAWFAHIVALPTV